MSADPQSVSPSAVIARQDRIQVWSLPYLFVFIIGIGFLFTFYDIFDINVSFLQTCSQIVSHCVAAPLPGHAVPNGFVEGSDRLGLPVLWNLIGYVIGALILSPLSDRFGRRDMLLVTMLITGLGSLATAFTNDYNTFIIARTITGIGIGADLAVVNTYINEVAPRGGRAKYTSLIFIMSALGAFVGIWLGLILTTPPGQFPLGLSFSQATVQPELPAGVLFIGNGWRIMYIVGAVLALVGILLRVQLPESPRWLVSKGRLQDADAVVRRMEHYASGKSGQQAAPTVMDEVPVQSGSGAGEGFSAIFSNPRYLGRVIFLLIMWFIAYVTVYTIAAGMTSVLAFLGYPPPEAGMIVAVGTIGFILCGIFAFFFAERLERKLWLPIGAVLTLIGGILIAVSGTFTAPTVNGTVIVAFIGSIILFFGFNVWVPITYAWSTENFPTRARTTGFGIVDVIGHIGGGVGLLFIAGTVLPTLGKQQNGVLYSFLVIAAFLIVAAIIAQFGIRTRNQRLDVVSP
ncbi:MAG TPA: MFS transporter [Ktedonobacterales bacterium]|nr:MFS transporter [Ktedonobacterales bacterium]